MVALFNECESFSTLSEDHRLVNSHAKYFEWNGVLTINYERARG